jgi:hypothetical protein
MDLPPISAFPPKMESLSLAWYRKEDWPRWCEICPDFQPDYQYWLRWAESALKKYEGLGQRLVKVVIQPEEFLDWSRINGGKIDTNARSAFAAFKTAKASGH